MCLELELALKEFVLRYQHQTILSDAILIEKAKLLASEIHQEKLHGEAASSDQTVIDEALPLLHSKCASYPLEKIYNIDETGTRSNTNHKMYFQIKKNKEHLSIDLCANADGSYKLDPLIIGKFAKPRCFKNVNINNLPMKYQNNNKAWMIITIFQEWLQEFDYQVARKHGSQRVLLLLDNCSSHKLQGLVLPYVEVYFLPPNTTSKIQLMDSGIIMSFKRHYRYFHIHWMLE
ncbi:CENP-B homolog protein 2-like [Rhizophagus clarus]|uniref:CENP-B homolog protein 2-like n=1 Tax=Rhizophagus clarus TaxID=94130 RepID=A0A8H3QL11_9GLOM|nr:CENP-B homolog protein 2-like [Rhizophagus clarus]